MLRNCFPFFRKCLQNVLLETYNKCANFLKQHNKYVIPYNERLECRNAALV